MTIPYRPLGLVKDMLETIGTDISYSYEDLVFTQHNHFLLQFGKSGEILSFHRNVDTSAEEAENLFAAIQAVAVKGGFTVLRCGCYRVSPIAGEENFALEFIDGSPSQEK